MNSKIILEKLDKLIKFLEEENVDITSCPCCNGLGIDINGKDVSQWYEGNVCDLADIKRVRNKIQEKSKKIDKQLEEERKQYEEHQKNRPMTLQDWQRF